MNVQPTGELATLIRAPARPPSNLTRKHDLPVLEQLQLEVDALLIARLRETAGVLLRTGNGSQPRIDRLYASQAAYARTVEQTITRLLDDVSLIAITRDPPRTSPNTPLDVPATDC